MRKSFYHFLMRYRHPEPNDEISVFANNAFKDHSFPKGSVKLSPIKLLFRIKCIIFKKHDHF